MLVAHHNQRRAGQDRLHVGATQKTLAAQRVLTRVQPLGVVQVAQTTTDALERTRLACTCSELAEVHGPFYGGAAARPRDLSG